MKELRFEAAEYTPLPDGSHKYKKTEFSIIGVVELLWSAVVQARLLELTRKEHKTIKNIKAKIREISIFKDKDEDSRISKPGEQVLILEDAEFEMLQRLITANSFQPIISDDIDILWTVVDGAKDYQAKLSLTP